MAEHEISLTIYDKGTLVMVNGAERTEFSYRLQGLRVQVKNSETGEWDNYGFFSKDHQLFTLGDRVMLDLQATP
jgi:hypothetical protein